MRFKLLQYNWNNVLFVDELNCQGIPCSYGGAHGHPAEGCSTIEDRDWLCDIKLHDAARVGCQVLADLEEGEEKNKIRTFSTTATKSLWTEYLPRTGRHARHPDGPCIVLLVPPKHHRHHPVMRTNGVFQQRERPRTRTFVWMHC